MKKLTVFYPLLVIGLFCISTPGIAADSVQIQQLAGHYGPASATDCNGKVEVEMWIAPPSTDNTMEVRAKFGRGGCVLAGERHSLGVVPPSDQKYKVKTDDGNCFELIPAGRSEHRYCLSGSILHGEGISSRVMFKVDMPKN